MTSQEYMDRLVNGDPRGWLGKCIDRLHNLSTLDSDDPALKEHFHKKKITQCKETREHILPLAKKLAKARGYQKFGRFFVDALTYWCERLESEVQAGG